MSDTQHSLLLCVAFCATMAPEEKTAIVNSMAKLAENPTRLGSILIGKAPDHSNLNNLDLFTPAMRRSTAPTYQPEVFEALQAVINTARSFKQDVYDYPSGEFYISWELPAELTTQWEEGYFKNALTSDESILLFFLHNVFAAAARTITALNINNYNGVEIQESYSIKQLEAA